MRQQNHFPETKEKNKSNFGRGSYQSVHWQSIYVKSIETETVSTEALCYFDNTYTDSRAASWGCRTKKNQTIYSMLK